jgi:transposase
MKPISNNIHNNIISLLDNGYSARQIATQLGLSHSTVNDVRSKARPNAWKSSGGRPTKLKATDKRNLVRLVTTGKANTATQLVRELKDTTNIDVCDDTIRNVLKEAGLKAITKKKKPKLSSTHIRQRLEFAKRYQYWTAEDWKCVIWSDETKVNRLGLSDGRKWTWKRPDSTLTEQVPLNLVVEAS